MDLQLNVSHVSTILLMCSLYMACRRERPGVLVFLGFHQRLGETTVVSISAHLGLGAFARVKSYGVLRESQTIIRKFSYLFVRPKKGFQLSIKLRQLVSFGIS